MGKLLVVRHGETDYNVQGRYCGSQDVPLNDEGLSQAQGAAAALSARMVDVVVSSPLQRARQTAEILNSAIGQSIVIRDEFRERCFGVYEGLTRDEAMRNYPELWQQNVLRQLDKAPAGGETIRDVRERVAAGLEYLFRTYTGMNVLLVAHGQVFREIQRYFHHLSDEETYANPVPNCAIAEYEFGRPELAEEQ